MHVATAHLVTQDGGRRPAVLDQARDLLRGRTASPTPPCRSNRPTTSAATNWAGEQDLPACPSSPPGRYSAAAAAVATFMRMMSSASP